MWAGQGSLGSSWLWVWIQWVWGIFEIQDVVSCKDLKVRGKNWTGNKLESHSDMDGNKNSYKWKRLEEKHGDEILFTTYFANSFIGIQSCTFVHLLSMAAFNMIVANWNS